MGNAGPDKGQGGKFLILPPDYKGTPPKGYFVFKSPTYGNLVLGRGFMKDGSSKPAADSIEQRMRVYPLSEAGKPHDAKFVELSGREMNTVHSNDFHFYEELNQIVQEEPEDSCRPDMMGIFNSIGMIKGQPFSTDERMKKILTDAVAIGNATARSIDFRNRSKRSPSIPASTGTRPSSVALPVAHQGWSSQFRRSHHVFPRRHCQHTGNGRRHARGRIPICIG